MNRKELEKHLKEDHHHVLDPRASKAQADQWHALAHRRSDIRSYLRLPTQREREDHENRLRTDAGLAGSQEG